MLIRKVQKIKESRLITLPAQICEAMGINEGDRFSIEIENSKIILTPAEPAKTATGAANTKEAVAC